MSVRSLIAEARAIRIPLGRIKKFAASLEKALHRKISNQDKPLGNTGALVTQKFPLKGAAGKSRDPIVVLRASPARGGSGDYVLGAGLGKSPKVSGPVIVIDINGSIPASSIWNASQPGAGGAVASRLYNVLVHELTHAADPGLPLYKGRRSKYGKGGSSIPTEDEIDTKAYYNAPEEVRAFAREVINDVDHMIAKWGTVGKLWAPGKALSILLKNSATWNRIEKYLTVKSRRKIIQILSTELRDRKVS